MGIGFRDAYYRNQFHSLFARLRALSADRVGITRPSYGRAETLGLDCIAAVAAEAGLAVERDAAANLLVSLPGDAPGLPAIATGSHMDSVPQGGNYDGAAGIIAGLMCLVRAKREGRAAPRTLLLIGLRGEESAWFGRAYIGSLAIFGKLGARDLERAHRDTGLPLKHYLEEVGGDPVRIAQGSPLIDPATLAAWYELHIEQGPLMVARRVSVGIVTGIRGNIRHMRVVCRGAAGHSGAVPRWLRQDAVFGMADLLMRLDEHWQTLLAQGLDLVVTSGVVQTNAEEHAPSRIPGEVGFSLEIRSQSTATMEQFYALMLKECQAIERNRGVRFEFDEKIVSAPGAIDPVLELRLARICDELQVHAIRIPSGAGHDAAVFANSGVPAAMIFIRNDKGSHNPYEQMDMDDFIKGAEVLYAAMTQAPEA